MTFADHFSAVAARYAAYRPHYPPALVQLLAEQAAHGVAWDVGCGNGQLAVALAEHFERAALEGRSVAPCGADGHVIATDPSQAQLAVAVAHPRVEYRCVTAEASGLPDASVDLVVAAQAAHWFDWPRFCDEATRIARPGALIALVSYGIPSLAGEPGRELAHYYHDVSGPYWLPERALVVSGYRDLAMPWPAVAAPAIEMTVAWTRDELVGYASTWSATSRLVAQHGTAVFDEFGRRLAATWPDAEPRTVSWPLGIRLARR